MWRHSCIPFFFNFYCLNSVNINFWYVFLNISSMFQLEFCLVWVAKNIYISFYNIFRLHYFRFQCALELSATKKEKNIFSQIWLVSSVNCLSSSYNIHIFLTFFFSGGGGYPKICFDIYHDEIDPWFPSNLKNGDFLNEMVSFFLFFWLELDILFV